MLVIETAEDQQKETFSQANADEEARSLFKKRISVYELMHIPLIYIVKAIFQ